MTEDVIVAIHNASVSSISPNDTLNTRLPTYAEQGLDNLSLIADVVAFMKQLVAGFIIDTRYETSESKSLSSEKTVWETVLAAKADSRFRGLGDDSWTKTVRRIWNLCWDGQWKSALKNTSFENDPQTFETMLS
ncbi:hypothetical protein HK096_007484, partial [Nowakowskiella sp. JEL0078]